MSAGRRFKSWGVSWEGIQFIQFGRGEGVRGGGRRACCQERLAYLSASFTEKEHVALSPSDENQSKLCEMEGFPALLCCAGARSPIMSPDLLPFWFAARIQD